VPALRMRSTSTAACSSAGSTRGRSRNWLGPSRYSRSRAPGSSSPRDAGSCLRQVNVPCSGCARRSRADDRQVGASRGRPGIFPPRSSQRRSTERDPLRLFLPCPSSAEGSARCRPIGTWLPSGSRHTREVYYDSNDTHAAARALQTQTIQIEERFSPQSELGRPV
jgi:hypothetical protein